MVKDRNSLQYKAETKFLKTRIALLSKQAFFASLCLGLKPQPRTEGLDTMSTNGKNLFYNPQFVVDCDPKIFPAAICHETLHVALSHIYRAKGRDPDVWNEACDHAINNILRECGFTIGEKWLADPRFVGMSADEIYNVLFKEHQQQKQDGQDDKDASGGNGSPRGKLLGSGGEPQPHAHDFWDKCGCGGMEEPINDDGNPMTEAEKRMATQNAKVEISRAMSIAAKADPGSVPGALKEFVEDLLNVEDDGSNILEEFLEQVTQGDYSYSRPNFRFCQYGAFLPHNRQKEVGTIIIAMDTSYSINHALISDFLQKMALIINKCPPQSLYVVMADTKVQKVIEYERGELPESFEIHGRGGTRFSPVFEWVKENEIEPTCLLYLTDMECRDYPAEDDYPDYPVRWITRAAVRTVEEYVPNGVPFGEVIYF